MLFLQAASQPQRVHATMQAVRDRRLTLCVSPELVAEVRDVLTRPELQARFPALAPDHANAFLNDVLSDALAFTNIPAAFTWPEHPDDDHVFNLAIAAE